MKRFLLKVLKANGYYPILRAIICWIALSYMPGYDIHKALTATALTLVFINYRSIFFNESRTNESRSRMHETGFNI